ncbi:MAG TPA: hypothetical protein VE007_04895 [Thermoanaerobaculia bacterium]|nr:hypothetical protein [Thermoanaerobaculia bacterium]
MAIPRTKNPQRDHSAVASFDWLTRTAEPLEPGPELDREIERRVFGRASTRQVPPFSTEDWNAQALAELVSRETGWWFDVSERDGLWSAMWIEPPAGAATKPRRILSLITATADTRAAAICRALLRATRCPRWPGVGRDAAGPLEVPAGAGLRLSTAS